MRSCVFLSFADLRDVYRKIMSSEAAVRGEDANDLTQMAGRHILDDVI